MEAPTQERTHAAVATTWTIDPVHSTVEFSVKHLKVATVRGRFSGFTGTIRFVSGRPALVEAVIDAASIDTGIQKRDNHLRSSDYLDVTTYPTIAFRGTSFRPVNANGRTGWIVQGALTIHGVTQPVELKVEQLGIQDPDATDVLEFGATSRIKRSAFGMTFSLPIEGGGLVVADEITIALGIKAHRPT